MMHVQSDDTALVERKEAANCGWNSYAAIIMSRACPVNCPGGQDARLRKAAGALVEFLDAGHVEDEPWNKGPDGQAPGRSLDFQALIDAVKKEIQ